MLSFIVSLINALRFIHKNQRAVDIEENDRLNFKEKSQTHVPAPRHLENCAPGNSPRQPETGKALLLRELPSPTAKPPTPKSAKFFKRYHRKHGLQRSMTEKK